MNSQLEITAFYQEILESFQNLFVSQDCKQDILDIIYALENNKPILTIMESQKGSFSTIFLPFHAGQIQPFNFRELTKIYKFNPNLIKFCELSEQIETITDEYPTFKKEPDKVEKEKLLKKLKEFIEILPEIEEFKSWLKQYISYTV